MTYAELERLAKRLAKSLSKVRPLVRFEGAAVKQADLDLKAAQEAELLK